MHSVTASASAPCSSSPQARAGALFWTLIFGRRGRSLTMYSAIHFTRPVAMAESPQKLQRPKELYIDEKWDKCIDLMVRRTVYGTLAGGAAALILLRELVASLCCDLSLLCCSRCSC